MVRRVLVILLLSITVLPTAEGRTYGVFFVSGAYSNVDPRQRGKGFQSQKRALDNAGIPWREVPIFSTRPFHESVPRLVEAIKSSDWDVYYLITFSMGGFIGESALIHHPELQDKLGGWIAYLTPFYGGATIDRYNRIMDMCDPFRMRRFFDFAGVLALCEPISQQTRLSYMRRYQTEIANLTATRPVLCVSSDSDEIVSPEVSVLPGATDLRVRGARHFDLTVGNIRPSYENVFADAFRSILSQNTHGDVCSEIMLKFGF